MERISPGYQYETTFPVGLTTILKAEQSRLARSQKGQLFQRETATTATSSFQSILLSKTSEGTGDIKQSVYATQVSGQNGKPRLTFRGGKVLKKPNFVSIYLGKFWQSVKGKAMKAWNDQFAKALFKSRHMDIWAQYGAGKGTFVGSDVVAPAKTPKTIDDDQIQYIVQKEIDAGRVPKEDGQTVYTVYLPPDTVLEAPGGGSSLDGIGGYHMSYNTADGKKVYYSAIVFAQGQNGIDFNGNPQDNISIASSHEWSEAVTDPDVNNGKLGWYNDTYGEIGDIPFTMGMPLSDIYGRIDGYAVQKEWSNKDGKAELVPAGEELSRWKSKEPVIELS